MMLHSQLDRQSRGSAVLFVLLQSSSGCSINADAYCMLSARLLTCVCDYWSMLSCSRLLRLCGLCEYTVIECSEYDLQCGDDVSELK